MDEQYEVIFCGKPIGKVQLTRQGLYVRVICRCIAPGDQVMRLYALGNHGKENLGVLVPDGEGLSLDKKIPAKRFDTDNLSFQLSPGCSMPQNTGRFIPICPEEPFFYIDRLKDAFLQSERGKNGIRITEHPEAL